MRKLIVIAVLILSMGTVAKAQDYNVGVGVRGGAIASGVSVKGFIDGANAIEGIMSFTNGFNVYALYERHIPVITNGFNFYYGAGFNLGSWKEKVWRDSYGNKYYENKFTFGIDGIVGLEYKISSIPLAISVDYKPCLNFVGNTGFKAYDFGLSARVTF